MFVNRVKVESTGKYVNQKKNNQVLRQSICDNCVFNKDIPYLSPKVKIFISSSNGAQFGNGEKENPGKKTNSSKKGSKEDFMYLILYCNCNFFCDLIIVTLFVT
ncbi:hypothetical protein GLOIN_2v1484458 [Rhizophagus irregularis DAOM 181602=DAOM 197198]|uniref:Uncharacterized protein n=1 Tax=Rhizophagus irregularis (strain DAOM 181602 / DAOM 197198 / MUCL 43194) TaxID=747089 RepID=A0A2P4PE77_RHIID|nr:hypothetical protein GLOIN_2v1484458 [Rhizophagus irregularis DAOM 181602=DAOM 197198]PKY19982.1 hypothetical protein RhiirB3_384518 [Rhizophagus irregularis]POG63685.1 hypothetical protein GLOIN_2v1484458 [Rhizophagus irregularis DAOM 181602=DAOM 197198]|eukprot:XP_025170551.1 hypothetical protein GLOIN_2v1484458 [Rhizophagus irregularis DAOM 181602=DAOM 197198]